ncbi:hypothetical protein RFM99_25750 [Mesorhizobium sp. VK4C]|uniref:hypothetical protein n=1 Tax=Mesorhizobium captivum TaxID=3072319 RepID=UPI002A24DFBB|nr:hypothetical protein [Mesorhizobium sp. VK4C]MDX8501806.1 hypothetical protein [Mesorhizobium sp. VK4C]
MRVIAGLEHDAAPWLILQMPYPSSNCRQVGFSRIFSASVPPANIETIVATNDACVRAAINSPGKDIGSIITVVEFCPKPTILNPS